MTTERGYFIPKKDRLAPRRDNYTRPKDNRVEYQIFGSDYFSAADLHLYFGDIFVDEITNINFQLQENMMPIYGYNSYTFDAVARGKRLVQGNFAMNFTSVGYLQQIVNNAHAIFHAIEQGEKQKILPPAYHKEMKLSEILEKLGKQSFDQIANEYEKALWGTEDDPDLQLSYGDRPYFNQDQFGFDIRLQYGAVAEASNYVNGKFYQNAKEEAPNLTVEVINGVQLTTMGKSVGTDTAGAPIQESYSFIARDFNGVGMAQLSRLQNNSPGNGQRSETETIYRHMQYGVIR